jgi:hypothetical protein
MNAVAYSPGPARSWPAVARTAPSALEISYIHHGSRKLKGRVINGGQNRKVQHSLFFSHDRPSGWLAAMRSNGDLQDRRLRLSRPTWLRADGCLRPTPPVSSSPLHRDPSTLFDSLTARSQNAAVAGNTASKALLVVSTIPPEHQRMAPGVFVRPHYAPVPMEIFSALIKRSPGEQQADREVFVTAHRADGYRVDLERR